MSIVHQARSVTAVALIAVAGLITATPEALAQESSEEAEKPSPEESPPESSGIGGEAVDDARARSAYQRGRALFEQQKYAESAAAFDEAYQLSKRPLLLLSIASAHERAGDVDLALRTLRAYRPHANQQNAGEVDYRIASLEERVATVESNQSAQGTDITNSTTPAAPKRSFNWPGWITTGAGVAALGAGGTFLILGELDHQDVANAANIDEAQSLIDSGDTKKLVGAITAGVGGAAVITGVVLLVTGVGTHEVDTSTTAFNFTPIRGGAYASLSWSF